METGTRYTWLLDNGHGGIIDGVYQTAGKRSPVWADGSQLFEGEFTRSIVNRLAEMLTGAGINYVVVTPELRDISLTERVRRANAHHSGKECIFVSIHSNAGGGSGYEVYTAPGETTSDLVADVFFAKFAEEFPGCRMRDDMTDGDVDKEADFYVLRHTKMPAILTECFFMDCEPECRRILMTEEGRDRIASAHFEAIKQIEELGV